MTATSYIRTERPPIQYQTSTAINERKEDDGMHANPQDSEDVSSLSTEDDNDTSPWVFLCQQI